MPVSVQPDSGFAEIFNETLHFQTKYAILDLTLEKRETGGSYLPGNQERKLL